MEHASPPVALVVEDDIWQRELASMLLEESKFDVVQCDSAEKALRVLEKSNNAIVLIFTDVNLAGNIDGVELAHFVSEHYPRIHITVTSGRKLNRTLPENATFLAKPWLALDVMREAELSIH
jgi:DNA-binding NtrC family response regulator